MKIILKELIHDSRLSTGNHNVKITNITEDIIEDGNIEFFQCKFENSEGFIKNRFLNNEQTLSTIAKLFRACKISIKDSSELDTNDLLYKELEITIVDEIFTNASSGEMKHIRKIVDYNQSNFVKFNTEEENKIERKVKFESNAKKSELPF